MVIISSGLGEGERKRMSDGYWQRDPVTGLMGRKEVKRKTQSSRKLVEKD
jgi:hypothetical protein